MPMTDQRLAAPGAVPASRREQIQRRRRQALRRSLAAAAVWATALLVAAWLVLAGIAGFAHA